jgi:hypothetical protein
LVKSKLKLDQNGVSTAPNQLWRDCNVKSPAKKPQQGLLNAGELRQEGHPGSQAGLRAADQAACGRRLRQPDAAAVRTEGRCSGTLQLQPAAQSDDFEQCGRGAGALRSFVECRGRVVALQAGDQ